MTNPPGRAVAYIRVSAVGDRGEDLISPELQRFEIDQYAARKNLEVVAEVRDIDKSGRSFTKRRVAQVIEAIRAGEYQTVILWKWSRWGRNLRESLIHLATVETAGGTVRAATEDFDPSTSVGRFTRDQMLLIAQLQSDQIGDSWRETHAKRRRDGLPHITHQRFGYRYAKGSKKEGTVSRYEKEEHEAKALKDAYERIAAGTVTFRGLAAEWNEGGLQTPAGALWTPTSLGRMLDTGFGAGLLRSRSNPRSGKSSLAAFDVWQPGAHEAVIDEELWQAYRDRRAENANLPPRLVNAKFALTGLMWCGLCEDAGNPRRMASMHSAWTCTLQRDTAAHRPVNVQDHIAMAAVLAWAEAEIETRDAAAVTAGAARRARVAKATGDAERLDARLAVLTKRRRNLTLQLADADEGVDLDEVRQLLADTAKEAESVRMALAAAKAEASEGDDGLLRMFQGLRDEWAGLEPNRHRAALRALLAKVLVYPGPRRHTRSTVKLLPRWAENAPVGAP